MFAVQGRQCLIPHECKEELYKYTTGIIKKREQKLIAINGMADHTHVLIGLLPTVTLSDLVRDIKAGSSGFINEKKWTRGRFNWQEGFGAFSHSRAEIDRVVKYIQDQEEHHRKKTFREEYRIMLEEFAVSYDARYIFKFIDDEKE